MPQELKYAHDEETIVSLHCRALRILESVKDQHDVSSILEPNVYNSILNMVGQVEISRVAVPQRMDIPKGTG